MQMNLMSFLLGKTIAKDLGEERSTQIGLLSGMMPGYQGVLISALVARRETPKPPRDEGIKVLTRQQLEGLRQSVDEALAQPPNTPSQNGGPRPK